MQSCPIAASHKAPTFGAYMEVGAYDSSGTRMTYMDVGNVENAGCIFSTMTVHPVHHRFGLLSSRGIHSILGDASFVCSCINDITYMDVGTYDLFGTKIMTLRPCK